MNRFEAVMKSSTHFQIFDNKIREWVKISIDNNDPIVYITDNQEQAMLISDELNNKDKNNV